MGVMKDLKNLIAGLGITGKHLGRHAITIQYPEQRDTIPERSRGIVVLLSDKETGELNCTACQLCMRACPTGAIVVEFERDENKRKILTKFDLDNTICCFCGLCEESCNFSALKLATKYEFSTTDKDGLLWDMHKLQEVGRDVPYVDTRKKKAEKSEKKPTPKPAPKPADEQPAPKDSSEAPQPADKTPGVGDMPDKPKAAQKPDDPNDGGTDVASDNRDDDTKREGND